MRLWESNFGTFLRRGATFILAKQFTGISKSRDSKFRTKNMEDYVYFRVFNGELFSPLSRFCELISHLCNTEIADEIIQDYPSLADPIRYFSFTRISTYRYWNVELFESQISPENHQFWWKLAFGVERKVFEIQLQFLDNSAVFAKKRFTCKIRLRKEMAYFPQLRKNWDFSITNWMIWNCLYYPVIEIFANSGNIPLLWNKKKLVPVCNVIRNYTIRLRGWLCIGKLLMHSFWSWSKLYFVTVSESSVI